MNPLNPTFEKKFFEKGYDLIVGIDEVGRGCLAGPLYFCAFLFFPGDRKEEGVKDSKQLSSQKREEIATLLTTHHYYLEVISNYQIDYLGLSKAMNQALIRLTSRVSGFYPNKKIAFLIDGYFKGKWVENIFFIPKGDCKVYSIAASSIIAKVFRDDFMNSIASKYLPYKFEKNVGYGTKEHRDAIIHNGISKLHRKSFRPMKDLSLSKITK